MQSIRQSLKTCYLELDSPLARKDFAIGVLSLVLAMAALVLTTLILSLLAKTVAAGLALSLALVLAIPAALLALCAPPIYILIWGWRRGLCSTTPDSGKWAGLALGIFSVTLLPFIGCVTLLIWPDPVKKNPPPLIHLPNP